MSVASDSLLGWSRKREGANSIFLQAPRCEKYLSIIGEFDANESNYYSQRCTGDGHARTTVRSGEAGDIRVYKIRRIFEEATH